MSQNHTDNPLNQDEEERFRFALSRTNIPGLVLITVGALNLFMAGQIIFRGFEFQDKPAKEIVDELKERSDGKFPPEGDPEEWKTYFVLTAFIAGSLGVVGALVTMAGGMYMRSLRNYRLVVAGAIIAIVPLISIASCFGVGLVAGIWALYVLGQPDVKNAFA